MPATLADIQRKYGEGIYPLYKDQMHEPYMENPNGIGVQGAVLYDEAEDKIQCSECGKWYSYINSKHLKTHNMNADEYKDLYGLSMSIPLCSKGQSIKRSDAAKKRKMPSNFNRKSYRFSDKARLNLKKGLSKISTKNRFGLCDAQIASRIMIVSYQSGIKVEKINGRCLKQYDPKLYKCLVNKYGTWKLASKALGMSFTEKWQTGGVNKLEDAEVIARLRNLVLKNKTMPTSFNIESKLIENHFGSWRRAKMMAGLDQLLEEVKNK